MWNGSKKSELEDNDGDLQNGIIKEKTARKLLYQIQTFRDSSTHCVLFIMDLTKRNCRTAAPELAQESRYDGNAKVIASSPSDKASRLKKAESAGPSDRPTT